MWIFMQFTPYPVSTCHYVHKQLGWLPGQTINTSCLSPGWSFSLVVAGLHSMSTEFLTASFCRRLGFRNRSCWQGNCNQADSTTRSGVRGARQSCKLPQRLVLMRSDTAMIALNWPNVFYHQCFSQTNPMTCLPWNCWYTAGLLLSHTDTAPRLLLNFLR